MPSLNSASTNNVYQSTFMPIFSNAEAMIKRLVIFAFFTGMSKNWLVFQIGLVIKKVKKDIPKDLFNRDAYVNGLIASSNLLVYQYEKTKSKEQVIRNKMIRGGMDISKKLTPQNLTEEFKKNRIWAEAKGYVNVKDYEKELNRFISNVSQCPFTTKEKGKRPISLWQKAELDVRYEKQMETLETLKSEGVELCWISSHPDCSKRCEQWQGKLVSLTKHATMSGFRVEKVNGNWVYSLPDIMAQVDKYGYHNNIICGFNCFDKETEVLTNHGWKFFNDLTEDDLIYTLNRETRISEWQKPINYFKKIHNGKMIRVKSYISDLLVTPDHNMLFYQQHDKSLRFKTAKDLNTTSHIQYAGQEWVGNESEFITVGKTQIKATLFCRLLGYYLADGCIQDGSSIKIAQQNNDEMWEKLQELPYKLWRDNNKILVRDKDLHDLFKQLGTCERKYVFDWVKELSKNCLTELLEAFNYTDGYKAKPTSINGYMRKPHKTLFTVSKQLCADLCEIALKCGYRPKVELRKSKGKEVDFKNGKYTLNYDLFIIHLNYNTSFKYKSITEEDYCDFVYCVEVPNHTVLVKRNGFIQWCGNCRHKLHKYVEGSVAPKSYDKEEIKRQREIETKIRAMERYIRSLKMKLNDYNIVNDKQKVLRLKSEIQRATINYKNYCEKNGYAWYQYRIDVKDVIK